MRNRMVCDGYFGCPDDYITPDKGNGEIFFDFFPVYVNEVEGFQYDIQ